MSPVKLCTSQLCVCVCVWDVSPSPFNYLLSLDKACGIHFRENTFFNIIQYRRKVVMD